MMSVTLASLSAFIAAIRTAGIASPRGASQGAGLPGESCFADGVCRAGPYQDRSIEQPIFQDGLYFCEPEFSQYCIGLDPYMFLCVADMAGEKAECQGT